MTKHLLAHLTAAEASGHGADPLTSIAMHLFPALMRPDLVPSPSGPAPILGLPVTGLGTAEFGSAEIQLPIEFPEAAPAERLTELGGRFVAHDAKETG